MNRNNDQIQDWFRLSLDFQFGPLTEFVVYTVNHRTEKPEAPIFRSAALPTECLSAILRSIVPIVRSTESDGTKKWKWLVNN